MAHEHLTDLELFEGWSRGDRGMGSAFYQRIAPKLSNYFRRNVYDRSKVEELVQETFLAAIKPRNVVVSNPRGYLFGIASHVFSAFIRKRRKDLGFIDQEHEIGERPIHDLDPDPEFIRLQRDEDRLFMKAMRKLPFEQQLVLELSFWEKMSGREIAEALNIAEGTVRSRIRLGRKRLQALLRDLAESPEQFKTATLSFTVWQKHIHEHMAGLDPEWDKDDDEEDA